MIAVASVGGCAMMACGNPEGADPTPTSFAAQQWCVGPVATYAAFDEPSGDLREGHATVVPIGSDAPVEVGSYRLVPRAYHGPTSLQIAMEQAGGSQVWGRTRDLTDIAESHLYVDINYLPAGYAIQHVEAVTLGDEVWAISWYFDGPLASTIEVSRTNFETFPGAKADVRLLGCGAARATESDLFHGHLVVVERDRQAAGARRLFLVADGVSTVAHGNVFVDELVKMLESFDPPIAASSN
jgi:hypothetical protein